MAWSGQTRPAVAGQLERGVGRSCVQQRCSAYVCRRKCSDEDRDALLRAMSRWSMIVGVTVERKLRVTARAREALDRLTARRSTAARKREPPTLGSPWRQRPGRGFAVSRGCGRAALTQCLLFRARQRSSLWHNPQAEGRLLPRNGQPPRTADRSRRCECHRTANAPAHDNAGVLRPTSDITGAARFHRAASVLMDGLGVTEVGGLFARL